MTQPVAELFWSRPDPGRRRHRARPGHRGQPLRLPAGRHRPDDHEVPAGRPQPAQRGRDVGGPGRELAPRQLHYPEVQLGSVRLLASPVERRAAAAGRRHSTARDVRRGAPGALRVAGRARGPRRETSRSSTSPATASRPATRAASCCCRTSGQPDYPVSTAPWTCRRSGAGWWATRPSRRPRTPPVQYYFYDACRVQPPGVIELRGAAGRADLRRAARARAGHVRGCCGAVGPGTTRWPIPRPGRPCSPRRCCSLWSRGRRRTTTAARSGSACSRWSWRLRSTSWPPRPTSSRRWCPAVSGPCGRRSTCGRAVTGGRGSDQPMPRPPGPSGEIRGRRVTGAVTVRIARRRSPAASRFAARPSRGARRPLETTTGEAIGPASGSVHDQRRPALGRTPTRVDVDVPDGSTPMDMWLEVPAQQPRTMAEAPRLGRLLGPSGGADARWYLRFLSWTPEGLRYRPENTPPAVEVDDVGRRHRGDHHARAWTSRAVRPAADRGRPVARGGAADQRVRGLARACWLHVRVSRDRPRGGGPFARTRPWTPTPAI